MSKSECPICKNNNITFDSSRINSDGAIVICPNCGKYKISGSDFVAMDNNKQDRELSFAIRTRYERGEDVYITTDKNNRRKILSGIEFPNTCLLYTSDAADDLLCVDLGGRRIIKKKKK